MNKALYNNGQQQKNKSIHILPSFLVNKEESSLFK